MLKRLLAIIGLVFAGLAVWPAGADGTPVPRPDGARSSASCMLNGRPAVREFGHAGKAKSCHAPDRCAAPANLTAAAPLPSKEAGRIPGNKVYHDED